MAPEARSRPGPHPHPARGPRACSSPRVPPPRREPGRPRRAAQRGGEGRARPPSPTPGPTRARATPEPARRPPGAGPPRVGVCDGRQRHRARRGGGAVRSGRVGNPVRRRVGVAGRGRPAGGVGGRRRGAGGAGVAVARGDARLRVHTPRRRRGRALPDGLRRVRALRRAPVAPGDCADGGRGGPVRGARAGPGRAGPGRAGRGGRVRSARAGRDARGQPRPVAQLLRAPQLGRARRGVGARLAVRIGRRVPVDVRDRRALGRAGLPAGAVRERPAIRGAELRRLPRAGGSLRSALGAESGRGSDARAGGRGGRGLGVRAARGHLRDPGRDRRRRRALRAGVERGRARGRLPRRRGGPAAARGRAAAGRRVPRHRADVRHAGAPARLRARRVRGDVGAGGGRAGVGRGTAAEAVDAAGRARAPVRRGGRPVRRGRAVAVGHVHRRVADRLDRRAWPGRLRLRLARHRRGLDRAPGVVAPPLRLPRRAHRGGPGRA